MKDLTLLFRTKAGLFVHKNAYKPNPDMVYIECPEGEGEFGALIPKEIYHNGTSDEWREVAMKVLYESINREADNGSINKG